MILRRRRNRHRRVGNFFFRAERSLSNRVRAPVESFFSYCDLAEYSFRKRRIFLHKARKVALLVRIAYVSCFANPADSRRAGEAWLPPLS
jgi:hypothetical protein